MLTLYYIVLAVTLILTLPLASRSLAFSTGALKPTDYSPLGTLPRGSRTMVYLMFVVIFVMMVMFCIGKPEDINDYAMYEYLYDSGMKGTRKDYEPSFAIITAVSPTFLILLAVYAALSCGTHLTGILRNSPLIWLSMVLYLGFTFVLHDVIQIRAGVAAGIFLISIRYIYERKWIVYFILVAFAMAFHYSAVVFIPLYFLPRKHMVKWFWIGALVLFMIMGLFGIQIGTLSRYIPIGIVEMYLESYMGSHEHSGSENGLVRYAVCVLLIVLVAQSDLLVKRYPYALICLASSIFSQICYLMFGDIAVLQSRLGELFGVMDIFTFAMIPLLSRKFYYILMVIPIVYAIYRFQSIYAIMQLV